MGNKSGLRIAAAFLLILTSATSAGAQSNQTDNTINALGNLFGALAQAGAKANAKKKWGQVTPEVKQCLNLMLTSKNVSVDQFADAGIAPDDQRVAPAINTCNQYLTTPLKTNFPCAVTNSKGGQVTTTCNQSYAKEVNGALVPISGEDMLIAAGGGEKVVAGNFETVEAQNARLEQEKTAIEQERIAAEQAARAREAQIAAERHRFLASAEGRRQAAVKGSVQRQAKPTSANIVLGQSAFRARFEKFAPSMQNAFVIQTNSVVFSTYTCKTISRIKFSGEGFSMTPGEIPYQLRNFAVANVYDGRFYFILNNRDVINDSEWNSQPPHVKGFPAGQDFENIYFGSQNRGLDRNYIGRIDFKMTADWKESSVQGVRDKIDFVGKTETAIYSMRGFLRGDFNDLNSRIVPQISVSSTSPSEEEKWDHFIAACRNTQRRAH